MSMILNAYIISIVYYNNYSLYYMTSNTSSLKIEDVPVTHQRRIVAFVGPNRDLIKVVRARIFTSTKEASHWLDSGLEGYLCFVTDKEFKSRFFVLYQYVSYKKLFEMELYNNFNQYYTVLNPSFHCFEFGEGFIGIKFVIPESAQMFKIVVEKFDDKLLGMLMMGDTKKKNNKDILNRNIKALKEKYASKTHYDSQYCEDGLFIVKPLYFDILNNIKFNKENNQFEVEGEETKQLLKSFGMKKSDMKNTKLALDIFKQMIITLENIDDTTEHSKINKRKMHHFMDKYKLKTIYHEDGHWHNLPTSSSISHLGCNDISKKNNGPSTVPNVPNVPNVPKVPNIPNIPNVPKVPINIPKVPNIPLPNIPKIPNISMPVIQPPVVSDTDTTKDSDTTINSKERDLLNIVLKKAQPQVEEEPLDSHSQIKKAIEKGVQLTKATANETKKITLNDKNILSMTLSYALEQRRKDMGGDKKEEDSDSDWSD
jgi:hypothetical protein